MNSKPQTILLVEDDMNLSYLLGENLKASGYNFKICNNGIAALDMINKQQFDLYILDLMLPDVDGFELAKTIRKKDGHKPFLFLTAVKTDQEKYKGYELGAEDYITKPFTFKELDYKMQVILRRFEKPQQEVELLIEKADLIFDTNARSVNIGEATFKLTKRESDLLKIFIANINEYIDRSQVLTQLWERDDIYTSRSMDVYITRLRKIISNSQFLAIENLYGSGYRLVQTKTK